MPNPQNAAYDYSVYEPVRKPEVQPRIKVRSAPQPEKKTASAIKMFLTGLSALLVLCGVLHGFVEESTLFQEQVKIEAELALLNEENVRMQSEIEAKTALKNVEDYAENVLGLQKLDKAQIEYFELESENVIEIVDRNDDNVFTAIKNWFKNAMEYIGL